MLDTARTAFNADTQSSLFSWLGVSPGDVVDLEGFENFVFGYRDRVIRITHDTHRTRQQLEGEVSFLQHLAAVKAPVASPLENPDGQLVSTRGAFHVCQFERAPGEGLRFTRFDPAVIREWGRCIGLFHRLAVGFVSTGRPNWQTDDNHRFMSRIPADQPAVQEKGHLLLERLAGLPQLEGEYGLIHSDAHPGNFLHDNGRLTFFDFDDCIDAWFGYDLATILFGVALQPFVDDSDQARVAAVEAFLPEFLEGYAKEHDPRSLMFEAMSEFINLRELSLYGVIHLHMDPDNLTDWYPKKFMLNRRERIEAGQPFVDLDFAGYSS